MNAIQLAINYRERHFFHKMEYPKVLPLAHTEFQELKQSLASQFATFPTEHDSMHKDPVFMGMTINLYADAAEKRLASFNR